MASPAQIAANIRNAQRSTGPRTDEGKRNSNQNSRTHGLRSQQPLHPTEDPAEFTKLVYSLMDDYAPANQTELLVVVQIAAAMWQVNQSLVWEWAYCADGMTTRAILQCALLARYRVPYQRAIYANFALLETLKKVRRVLLPQPRLPQPRIVAPLPYTPITERTQFINPGLTSRRPTIRSVEDFLYTPPLNFHHNHNEVVLK
jgi:hypothetical protein